MHPPSSGMGKKEEEEKIPPALLDFFSQWNLNNVQTTKTFTFQSSIWWETAGKEKLSTPTSNPCASSYLPEPSSSDNFGNYLEVIKNKQEYKQAKPKLIEWWH